MTQYPGPQDRPAHVPPYGSSYVQPPGYGVDPAAPYGRDPMTGAPYSDKSKVAAGVLQIFLGTLGVGRFYMGSTGVAVAQLVLTLIGWLTAIAFVGFFILAGVSIWALVDGILILAGRPVDALGRPLRP